MAAVYDHIREFDSATEERQERYLVANNINSKAKQCAIPSICGSIMYRVINNLISSIWLDSKMFHKLVSNQHHYLKPLTIFRCFQFNSYAHIDRLVSDSLLWTDAVLAPFVYRFSPFAYHFSPYWEHFDNGNIVSMWSQCGLKWYANGLKWYANGASMASV